MPVELWRANFGSWASLHLLRGGDVGTWETDVGDVALVDGFPRTTYGDRVEPRPDRGRFEIADLGKGYRLAWPAGACELATADRRCSIR